MMELEEWIETLQHNDAKKAYESLKLLMCQSEKDASVYPYMDVFIEMLRHENSYFRVRGLLLIAANARWDLDYKIDEVIDEYLKHIMDEKPITARKCIQALPQIAFYKPELKEVIEHALHQADPGQYRESMGPLIHKDIMEALQKIKTQC